VDVSKLTLRNVVLHAVPKASAKDKQGASVTLSDLAADLDGPRRAFLEEKIRTTLRFKARPVVEELATPAANVIRAYLQAEEETPDLVAASRQLAEMLYTSQPGISPAGVVLVAEMEYAGSRALLFAKLDREAGMRSAFVRTDDGQLRVDIDFLEDLFVTDGTKVFKIGVFATDDIKADGTLRGTVVDEQSRGHEVARFFMSTFLGCGFSQRPQELTENFMRGTEDFINSSRVPDAETKARYTTALLSTLQSQAKDLSVIKFATDFLDPGDRDAYVSAMTERGVLQGLIKKDTSLVQSRLKRVQIETEHDVFIMAPPARLEDGTITIKPGDAAGRSVVEVTDEVRTVKSRG
jgi:nucleoid-associated protein YejK